MGSFYDQVLSENGFERIAEVTWEFPLSLYWHSEELMQVSVVPIETYFLIKGTKAYRLISITPAGETFIRDLNGFHNYLVEHFPEIHVSFSSYSVPTPGPIYKRIESRRIRDCGTDDVRVEGKEETLKDLRGKLDNVRRNLFSTKGFIEMSENEPSLLRRYLEREYQQQRREGEELGRSYRKIESELIHTRKIVRDLERKGVAASLLFTYSSNLQAVQGIEDFRDGLAAVRKEIRDAHHYQIRQKLQGGRLQIYVEEVNHPALAFQIEWDGGILNPRQLTHLGEPFRDLLQKVEDFLEVYPSADIEVDRVTKDQKKLLPAKALQNFFMRLEKTEPLPDVPNLPLEGGWLGHFMTGNQLTSIPFLLTPEPKAIQFTGTAGSGKTYNARAMVEDALIDRIEVVILDPTLQWCGLGKANTSERALRRFDQVGVGREYVRGFDVRIFTPGSDVGLGLPSDLEDLFAGCSIITLKGLSDFERCRVARDVLQCAYSALNQESESIELLVVMEEASTFLPESVNQEAKEIAKEVRTLISRISREKRKYGCVLLFITQSLSDFRGESKIVRDMINTRVFHRSVDIAEREYIENYTSREIADEVKNLKTGEAILHCPDLPGIKYFVRAPFSSVRELNDDEIRKINGGCRSGNTVPGNDTVRRMLEVRLTEKEEMALKIIRDHYERHGVPIKATELEKIMKVRGGTRQRLLERLVETKLIKRVELEGRGNPLGLIPL